MPFIRCSFSRQFTEYQAEEAAKELGRLIELFPGKDGSRLMLEFHHSPRMFFRGSRLENGAFIDCRILGAQSRGEKKEFTEALCKALEDIFGILPIDVFVTFTQYEDWGTGGTLKAAP